MMDGVLCICIEPSWRDLTVRRLPLRAIVEAGVLIALAAVLSTIKIYRMPQGGSITAGSMIPILLIGLRWGAGLGLPAGIAYGIVRFMLSAWFVHPVQWVLDYPLAFGALGLSGFFRRHPLLGVAVGIGGRFLAHLVAGVVFYASAAPAGQSPWVYSAIYQASYLVPELAVSLFVAYLLSKTPVLRGVERPQGR
jgi:thiamine transporter